MAHGLMRRSGLDTAADAAVPPLLLIGHVEVTCSSNRVLTAALPLPVAPPPMKTMWRAAWRGGAVCLPPPTPLMLLMPFEYVEAVCSSKRETHDGLAAADCAADCTAANEDDVACGLARQSSHLCLLPPTPLMLLMPPECVLRWCAAPKGYSRRTCRRRLRRHQRRRRGVRFGEVEQCACRHRRR